MATLSKGMASDSRLLQQDRTPVSELGLEEARTLLDGNTVFLDVREQSEWNLGHVPDAVLLPRARVEGGIAQAVPDKSARVVVYCARGLRSALAAETLRSLGYERVENLVDGFLGWEARGLPTVVPSTLPAAQRRRYSRHMLIPEVGEEGQRRLLAARVLLIGAGGLGSPASLYLAAAGVGTLGIVDDDVVDESNLQRQIAHSTQRLGDPKVDSARDTLQALNPDVEVKTFRERLTSENVERILAEDWDVIVDGADNFPTRYLVNDASVWHGIPVVHGSIYRFEGQVTVFQPGSAAVAGKAGDRRGPCYRCLFPTPPPPELAPSCAEGGVLGVLPGVVGSLQANETIKLVLGIGDSLVGRLLLFDALAMTFTEVALRRDPGCPVCGDHPSITEYVDYVEFCSR
jgi:sulfur-carrier protein adenylyltransferase/sulfurtransferase